MTTIRAKTKNKSENKSKIQLKGVISRINPPVKEGADFLVDYLFRVIIFLFPLYMYETKAVMGITDKDLLAGIIVLIIGLWCLYKSLKKGMFQKFALDAGKAFGVLVFLALLIVFGIQFVGSNGEVAHTYLYIVAMLLFFSSFYAGGGTRYYLGLLTASFTLVYISLYRYVFTGTATIMGAESLISKPKELAPLLMLSILIMSILYLTENNANLQKLYLFLAGAGMILFFLYGDMMGFCMMFLMIMGLCYIKEPTVGHIKRSLVLTFLYGFCASNAPLITYFGAKGISREFDLEYSIYIDIVIAVVGLIVTSYWDKMENKDQDEVDASAALMWYGRGMLMVGAILFIAFIFGSKGVSLKKSFGGKALYGFTNSMWEAVKSSSGEIWHVLQVYGVIGVVVMVALGVVLVYRMAALFKSSQCDAVEKGYLAIAVLFLVQGFFYPYSSWSLPLYMILAGIGVTTPVALKEMEPAAEKLAKESTVSSDESDLKVIWLPSYVRQDKIETSHEEVKEDTKQKRRCAEFGFLGYVMASALAAGLIVLIVVGVYRVIFPVDSIAPVESMIQVAIDEREEKFLAMAQEEMEEGEISAGAGLMASYEQEEVNVSAVDGVEATISADSAAGLKSKAGQAKDDKLADQLANAEEASSAEVIEEVAVEPEAGVSHGDYHIYDPKARYKAVNEVVTGTKAVVNLRNKPSVLEDSVVEYRLRQGETVTRIGIGENGWSKVKINGQELYAVSEYLTVYKAPEQAQEEAAQDASAQEEAEKAVAEQNAKEAQNANKPKQYTCVWSGDSKSITIWSSGVLQGSLSITNAEGVVQQMINYPDFYQGSGKDQKRYMNIYVKEKGSALAINADVGFVNALKEMGYAGVYFNKQIHNW